MKQNLFLSTVFLKIVMAVTGIMLVGFIAGHAIGNLQLFLGKETYNAYAHFLQKGMGEGIWVIRFGVILAFIVHIYVSIKLRLLNWRTKPAKYQVKHHINSTFYSRTMIWTGLLVVTFLVYHLLHFTIGTVMPEAFDVHEHYGEVGKLVRHDAYAMVVAGFSNLWVAISYIVSVIVLGFHLSHSIQSMFQTLGLGGIDFTPKAIIIGKISAIIITLIFLATPVGVMLGIIG